MTSSCGPGLVEAGDGVDRRQRVGPGHDDVGPPRTFAGQPAAADEREQTGPDERRLAAAGCADDGDEPAIEHPRRELGDEPLAADEQIGVRRLVARQRAVRLASRPLGAHQRRAPAASLDEPQHLVEHRRSGDRRRRPRTDRDRGGNVQPIGCRPFRPRRGLAPGDAGQAAGHRDRGVDRFGVDALAADDRGDLAVGHRCEVERADARALELADQLDARPVAVVTDQHEQQHQPLGRGRQRTDRVDARRRRPLHVVDDEQQRRDAAAHGRRRR